MTEYQQIILNGDPRTKKNSQRVFGRKVLPSKAYEQYRSDCLWQLHSYKAFHFDGPPIGYPVNVRCEYYMKTRRKVDLVNLIEATLDILVDAGILLDDNCGIAASHDGSGVRYDKADPRAVITITPKED